jgi:hypothetical protein
MNYTNLYAAFKKNLGKRMGKKKQRKKGKMYLSQFQKILSLPSEVPHHHPKYHHPRPAI